MAAWVTGLWTRIALSERSISTQFLIVSVLVLCLSMAVLGQWVNQQIKHSVLITSAAQAGEFLQGFVEPYVQVLEQDGSLTIDSKAALDALFIGTPLGTTVVSVKIWRADGLVLYATTKDLIGQQFVSTDVAQAAEGEVVAEYEDLISQESAYEQTLPMHLIEVYAPLYLAGTDKVMAVGEIYENADALATELQQSQMITWVVVGATTLFMIGALYIIVRRGASTIARQRTQLRDRYDQARLLAKQNAALRNIADESRLRASEANEQFLARIGSDIHDGPIQLLTLSTLRLTAATRAMTKAEEKHSLTDQIETAVRITQDALAELRNISTGLSLPELNTLGLQETISLAVARHEDLTGERVNYRPSQLPEVVSEALKICVYRVIQEGLTNATKYAPGAEKYVRATTEAGQIIVEVIDEGPGMTVDGQPLDGRTHLGLAGMRNRVEALNGSVALDSSVGVGTHLVARLPLELKAGAA